jgi:TetR/AcrR family transcriptional regulator
MTIRRGPPTDERPSSRDIVLKAAIAEFAEYGLSGGRVDRIAKRAKLNKQAIYYYFKSKDALFGAALAYGYTQFRVEKPDWDAVASPIEAMRECVRAIFYAVQENRNHASLIIDENRSQGRHINRVFRSIVSPTTYGTFQVVAEILERGQSQRVFNRRVSAEDVYLDIVSLSFFVFDHRYTIREIIGKDLESADWLGKRCAHVQQFILAGLMA